MGKLNVRQELAINELLKGNSIVESAKNVGVSEATLNRWLANTEFKVVLNERKSIIVDNCIDKINLLGNKAITVLNSMLDDENVSSNVRLNASKSILDMILKFNEQRNIMNKMKEIEELLNEKVGASNG
ncbi:phage protein [Mycoplasma sp. CAG:776]|nr:phage protein [Mycoplasma sp. CAG:776]